MSSLGEGEVKLKSGKDSRLREQLQGKHNDVAMESAFLTGNFKSKEVQPVCSSSGGMEKCHER